MKDGEHPSRRDFNAFRRRALTVIALAASLPVPSGCSPRRDPELGYSIRRSAHGVVFAGPLTDASVTALIRTVRRAPGPVRALVMTSTGGDAFAGMRLGRFVAAGRLGIRVRRFCFSACAQYVFLAAADRFVEDGGLVLFHGSPRLLRDAYAAAGRGDAANLFSRGAVEEARFYRTIGIDFDSTTTSWFGLRPLCLVVDRSKPKDDPARFQLATRYASYALSASSMRSLGVSFRGDWPADIGEATGALSRLPFSRSFTLSMIDRPTSNGAVRPFRFPALEECGSAA